MSREVVESAGGEIAQRDISCLSGLFAKEGIRVVQRQIGVHLQTVTLGAKCGPIRSLQVVQVPKVGLFTGERKGGVESANCC
jgi:hypothetical protein